MPGDESENIMDHLSAELRDRDLASVGAWDSARVTQTFLTQGGGPTAYFEVIRYLDGEIDRIEYHHSWSDRRSIKLEDDEVAEFLGLIGELPGVRCDLDRQ